MKMWDEFKSFAFKGNMIDLAVAVVVGTAFGKVVTSLVADVMMPAIAIVMPGSSYKSWEWHEIKYGAFLSTLVDFVIVALVVFVIIVKVMGALVKRAAPAPAPSQPTTKECPKCLMVVPLKATKCGHCTSDLM